MIGAGRNPLSMSVNPADLRGLDMGEVAVLLRVMPVSRDTNLEKVRNEITSKLAEAKILLKDVREKPIAFGLKYLDVLVILPDSPGGSQKVEDIIKKVHGVESVETDSITLL